MNLHNLIAELADALLQDANGIPESTFAILATIVDTIGLPTEILYEMVEISDGQFYYPEDDVSFREVLEISKPALIDLPIMTISIPGEE